MAGYYEEMGWTELQDGEQPNHLLHMARFLIDFGYFEDNLTGEWPRLPPPASKTAVEGLTDIIIEKNNEACPICLKNFSVGEKAKVLPCEHRFHSACILVWLERTNTCPYCRYELPTNDKDYEALKKDKFPEFYNEDLT